ncbi:S8 family serine peptidase [Clostridium tagluense]|uniref:S8 family serine peptidase n=1 Tax=Clostridium tagluense TaxID=360422 RepID=UPI001C0C8294|nr:S8 family serine peptidase [Clostridium tagluense]MBU3128152.1 S8 family serine peptidase [Clostridium tagluense]
MKKKIYKLLTAFVFLIFAIGAFAMNVPNDAMATTLEKNQKHELQREPYKEGNLEEQNDLDKIVRVIVQMKEEPVVKNKNTTEYSILKNQQPVKQQVMLLEGANLRHSYGYLVNGFSMDIKISEIPKIEKMYGVKSVREVTVYEPCMTTAKELTQVYQTWENLKIKGEGMVVAVIDSGIDVNHKDMRLTDESTAALSKEAVGKTIIEKGLKGKYFTTKVPYAYNYAEDSVDVKDTKDSTSHGMHVAGIVGANGKAADVAKTEAIQGVAPECQIIAMKVFANKGTSTGASSDDIVKAIEDSVKLRVDVINMSLGSTGGFQTDEDAEQIAIKNATDAGVVVVVSAGNSYYSTYPKRIPGLVDIGLVGTPGIAKDALQVASYENIKITTVGFEYTSLKDSGKMVYSVSEEADPIKVLKDPNGYELVYCEQGNKDGDYRPGELKGKIALIEKTDGTYGERKLKAQKAGAIGTIIYSTDGNEGLVNVSVKEGVTIPCIYVGHASGTTLRELISKGLKIKFTGNIIVQKNGDGNSMSGFSSWGPAPNLEFKPQITGIGGNINSTLNDNKYGLMGGTSMSSPHVAGGEALILQGIKANKKISLKGRELVDFTKSTSINTSLPIMDKNHNEVPYSPRRQGAGLIQLKDAIANRVIAKGKDGSLMLALKEIGKEKSFEVILKNYSNEDITYNVNCISGVLTEDNNKLDTTGNTTFPFDVKIQGSSLTFEKDGNYVLVDGTSAIRVPANGNTTLTFKINLPDNFATEQFVEGFIRFESRDKETIPSVGIPFMGFYGNWSKPIVIDAPAWEREASVTKKSFLIESAKDGLYVSGYTGKDAEGNYIIDKEKIFISPNGDGKFDNVIPELFFFRNVKTVEGDIENSLGKVVKTFTAKENVRKAEGLEGEKAKAARLLNLKWDGKLDDGNIAPDGQYKFVVKSTVDLEGSQPQQYYLPVKIDGTAPKLEITSPKTTETKKYTVQFKAEDEFLGLGKVVVNLNGKDMDKTLIKKTNNVFSCEVELIDGYNKINVSAYDLGENKITKELIIKFGNAAQDKEPPTIELASKPGSTTSDYIFMCKVTDAGSGVASVSIALNGEKIDSSLISRIGDMYSYKTILKTENNVIKVTAEDNEKNIASKEFNIGVKEDKEGPIVELLSPAISSTKEYKLKFKMMDELSDVDFYLAYFNEKIMGSSSIKKDGDIYSSDLELLQGDNIIKISVYDKLNNVTRKSFIIKMGDLSKDSVAPKIELKSSNVSNVSKYIFSANITDDLSGVSKVSIWLNNVQINSAKIVKTGDVYSSQLELKEGENKIKVVATDIAKNEATKELSVKYDKGSSGEDKEGPSVELVSEKKSNISKYKLQCKITDPSGINYVAYKVNGIRKSTITGNVTIDGDIYSCDLDLVQGDNKIEVSAKDNKNNYSFPEFIVKYETSIADVTAPKIDLTSSDKSSLSRYALNVKITDELSGVAKVSMWLNDVEIASAQVIKTGDAYSTELYLKEGENKIKVTATDKQGNVSNKECVIIYTKGLSIKLKNSIIDNGEAKISFEVINPTEKPESITLIIGLFDNYNKLISYKVVNGQVGKNEQIILSEKIQLTPNGTRIKCFIWDSLEGMKPFIDATEIIVP